MANNCGLCQLFQGPGKKCGGGRTVSANTSAISTCFKGPASLFKNKVCGACRLFQGPGKKCGGGRTVSGTTSAISTCYAPIPG
jgi:hypothetical protein